MKTWDTRSGSEMLSRRETLIRLGQAGLCLPLACRWMEASRLLIPEPPCAAGPAVSEFGAEDNRLLDEIEMACFQFFREQADAHTGLVKDRSKASGNDKRTIASIAATGFGLTGLCIAERRGFIARGPAVERAGATLRFLWQRLPH